MFKFFSFLVLSSFIATTVCMEQNTQEKSARELSNGAFKTLAKPSAHPFIFIVSRGKAQWLYEKANNQILNDFEHKDRKNDPIKYE
ncbi:MAG: hypothetical protein BWY54_00059 [Candidatus Dependentiae bacterium ADurb.Bin331]|nr:MAG: hypothetical protein BWY54_00059 [Candidatus Dependentiae bacterium ADurb.Bin331]